MALARRHGFTGPSALRDYTAMVDENRRTARAREGALILQEVEEYERHSTANFTKVLNTGSAVPTDSEFGLVLDLRDYYSLPALQTPEIAAALVPLGNEFAMATVLEVATREAFEVTDYVRDPTRGPKAMKEVKKMMKVPANVRKLVRSAFEPNGLIAGISPNYTFDLALSFYRTAQIVPSMTPVLKRTAAMIMEGKSRHKSLSENGLKWSGRYVQPVDEKIHEHSWSIVNRSKPGYRSEIRKLLETIPTNLPMKPSELEPWLADHGIAADVTGKFGVLRNRQEAHRLRERYGFFRALLRDYNHHFVSRTNPKDYASAVRLASKIATNYKAYNPAWAAAIHQYQEKYVEKRDHFFVAVMSLSKRQFYDDETQTFNPAVRNVSVGAFMRAADSKGLVNQAWGVLSPGERLLGAVQDYESDWRLKVPDVLKSVRAVNPLLLEEDQPELARVILAMLPTTSLHKVGKNWIPAGIEDMDRTLHALTASEAPTISQFLALGESGRQNLRKKLLESPKYVPSTAGLIAARKAAPALMIDAPKGRVHMDSYAPMLEHVPTPGVPRFIEKEFVVVKEAKKATISLDDALDMDLSYADYLKMVGKNNKPQRSARP